MANKEVKKCFSGQSECLKTYASYQVNCPKQTMKKRLIVECLQLRIKIRNYWP